jgi:hypothetical protein
MLPGGELLYGGAYHDTHELKTLDGRQWKFTYNGSIRYETKWGRIKESASWLYNVELISPYGLWTIPLQSLG